MCEAGAESGSDVIVCDLAALTDPDLGTVNALARLRLLARRVGRELQFRHAPAELRQLLALTGLADVLDSCPCRSQPRGQPEEREQPGHVEERIQPDDPTA